jgi:hypothetical protein
MQSASLWFPSPERAQYFLQRLEHSPLTAAEAENPQKKSTGLRACLFCHRSNCLFLGKELLLDTVFFYNYRAEKKIEFLRAMLTITDDIG